MKAMILLCKYQYRVAALYTGSIGRFDDSFNLNCIGDFSSNGSSLLFEAGHFEGDYQGK
jgi:hypothetical protein